MINCLQLLRDGTSKKKKYRRKMLDGYSTPWSLRLPKRCTRSREHEWKGLDAEEVRYRQSSNILFNDPPKQFEIFLDADRYSRRFAVSLPKTLHANSFATERGFSRFNYPFVFTRRRRV
ncbi:hypothetical protein K0M31_003992 [Melipona bicolor]|uniref:Uncharacterized protein n=1 Tax=Melipona bicolor TaxID=60889 RepID=A0AA40KP49_9HYME|nr:hypothetical protein K0M31_003992 [Melipona bicolor]